MDYRHLLPVITSLKYVDHDNLNDIYLNIFLFDHRFWSSRIWEHFTVLRMSMQFLQSGDHDLLTSFASGRFSTKIVYLFNQQQQDLPRTDGFESGIVHYKKKIFFLIGLHCVQQMLQ